MNELLEDPLKQCLEHIRFARATELARFGHYWEAEGVLAPNGRVSSDPRDLDLLARISAQQRQYGRARSLWEAALKQSPDNTEYERAIECARDAEHFQRKLRKVAMIALVTFSAAILVIAVLKFFPRRAPTVHTKTKPLPRELPLPHLTQDSQSPAQNSNSTEATPRQNDPATPQPATEIHQVATPPSAPAPTEGTPAVPQPTPIAPQPTPASPEPATPHPVIPFTIPPKTPSTTITPVVTPRPVAPDPAPTNPAK